MDTKGNITNTDNFDPVFEFYPWSRRNRGHCDERNMRELSLLLEVTALQQSVVLLHLVPMLTNKMRTKPRAQNLASTINLPTAHPSSRGLVMTTNMTMPLGWMQCARVQPRIHKAT